MISNSKTMDSRILFVWMYALGSVGGLLMVVTAQPAVNTWIVTPEADRKEGGQVEMRCDAYNLESNHIVEWRIEEMTLRWDNNTQTNKRRFEFETTHTGTGQTTQVFNITDLQRDDTDEYICNVHEPKPGGGSNIVVTSSVMLSLLYFPNESFPICSPDGPITVDIGTELNMQCSSEAGNLPVTMEVFTSITRCDSHSWTASTINDTLSRSLILTVDIAEYGTAFICVISSMFFNGMRRSCTIGPIRIAMNDESEPPATQLPTVQPTPTQPPTCSPVRLIGLTVSVVSLILLAVSAIINIFVISRNIKLRRQMKSPNTDPTPVPHAEAYIELQPRDDMISEYMEPTVRETSNDHVTLNQTVQGRGPEDDYERLEDKIDNQYEAVREPDNRQEQNQDVEG